MVPKVLHENIFTFYVIRQKNFIYVIFEQYIIVKGTFMQIRIKWKGSLSSFSQHHKHEYVFDSLIQNETNFNTTSSENQELLFLHYLYHAQLNRVLNFNPFLVRIRYKHVKLSLNPFSANFTKWSDTLKQFVGSLTTNRLSVWPFCGIGAERVKQNCLMKNKEIRPWLNDFVFSEHTLKSSCTRSFIYL